MPGAARGHLPDGALEGCSTTGLGPPFSGPASDGTWEWHCEEYQGARAEFHRAVVALAGLVDTIRAVDHVQIDLRHRALSCR